MAVVISVTKEGVKFSTGGDIGSANIVCRQNISVDKVSGGWWTRMLFRLGLSYREGSLFVTAGVCIHVSKE